MFLLSDPLKLFLLFQLAVKGAALNHSKYMRRRSINITPQKRRVYPTATFAHVFQICIARN
jgi:hypothetical protein